MNPSAKAFVPQGYYYPELSTYEEPEYEEEVYPVQQQPMCAPMAPFVLDTAAPAPAPPLAPAPVKTLRASAAEFRPSFLMCSMSHSTNSLPQLAQETPVTSPNQSVSDGLNTMYTPIQEEDPTGPKRRHYTLQGLLALRCLGSRPLPSVEATEVYVPMPVEQTSNRQNSSPSISTLTPMKPNALRTHKEGVAFLERRVISTLNKLTPEKYDTLMQDLLKEMGVELRVSHEGMEAMLQRIIPRIVDKAIMESNFCDMYAQLCGDLFKEIRNLDNGAIIHTEVIDADNEMTFDSSQRFQIHLLNKLQKEFQAPIPDDDDDKARQRKLSTAHFVGEIFFRGLLPSGVLHKVVCRLLNTKNVKVIDVECVCKLFPVIGKKLETDPAYSGVMNQYFAAVRLIRDSPVVQSETRIKVILDNLIELRQHKWVPRHETKKAKKITGHVDPTEEEIPSRATLMGQQQDDKTPKSLAERLRGIIDGKHATVPVRAAAPAKAAPSKGKMSHNSPNRNAATSKDVDGMKTTVYITHIDVQVTEGQLMEFLTTCGEINKVRLCGNVQQPTQYGFFEFATIEGAERCLAADRTILGRHGIHCSMSRTAVHDTMPHDVIMGPRGPTRACMFGMEDPNRPLSSSMIQRGDAKKDKMNARTPNASMTSLSELSPGLVEDDMSSNTNSDDAVVSRATSNLAQEVVPTSNTINLPALLQEYLSAYSSTQERDIAVSQQLSAGVADIRAFIKDAVNHVVQKQKLSAEREAVAQLIAAAPLRHETRAALVESLASCLDYIVQDEIRMDVPMVWANVAHLLKACREAGVLSTQEDISAVLQPVQASEDEWGAAEQHMSGLLVA